MNEPVFIRGLWGDEKFLQLHKVHNDVKVSLAREHQPGPVVTYCYGEHNHEFLKSVGVDSILLDARGCVKFFGHDCERRSLGGERFDFAMGRRGRIRKMLDRALVNWGESMLIHKTMIWDYALTKYGEIVWLDWDCWMHDPLPSDFWQRLREGSRCQATLRQYVNGQCPWRKEDIRKVPSAAFVYLCGRDLSRAMIEITEKHTLWREEQALAYIMDAMDGGWKGPEHWRECGHHPYCHFVRSVLWEPEVKLFTAR